MNAMSDFVGGGAPKKWVSLTNYVEGHLVWSPTDYQYYMRKSTGAGSTDPASDPTNWIPTGNRAIKSIQRGVATGNTATISAVDPAKTECRWIGGTSVDTNSAPLPPARFSLTNATTLTFTMVGGGSTHSTSWELTERY